MGIIRLTLITIALIWGAMYYFGRDEGLPENRLGRDPTPEEMAPAETPAPETAAVVEDTTEPEPVAADALDAPTQAAAPDIEPIAAPAPDRTPEPEPDPMPMPEPEPESAPEPAPVAVLYVSGRVVNVRSGPSTAFAAITSLQRGAPVIDLGDAGDGWREIQLESGAIGYMSGDFLSPDPQ